MELLHFRSTILVLLFLLVTKTSIAEPSYDITTLGLNGSQFTRDDGFRSQYSSGLNEAGQVFGNARRYSGASQHGQSAWFFDGNTTVEIGLAGGVHTRVDGYQSSSGLLMNEAGQVLGNASRFNGMSNSGASLWLYDGNNTQEIGLSGSLYTRDDGYQHNFMIVGNTNEDSLNEAGQVVGMAERFSGIARIGDQAWLYDSGTIVEIGLSGGVHERADGFQDHSIFQFNEAGQVLGRATRFDGMANHGGTVWLYNGTSTVELGLTGAAYTRDDGYRASDARRLNQAGQVAGTTGRYSGANNLGSSSWIYNGGSTTEIGLTGSEHTRVDGYRYNSTEQLNESGQVAGEALRFEGMDGRGRSAWLYNGVTTTEIGLKDSSHTDVDGYQYNKVVQMNEAGQVLGEADRYTGGIGNSAWLFNGANTVEIGLSGGVHTGADGSSDTEAIKLNEAGQVIGNTRRYDKPLGGQSAWFYDGVGTKEIGLSDDTSPDLLMNSALDLNDSGQVIGSALYYVGTSFIETSWFYDAALDQVFSHDFSVTSLGRSFSRATYLGDDGLMLGFYTLFDSSDNAVGKRAFSFTVDDGFNDLGMFVDNLSDEGWLSIADAFAANSTGQIIGRGTVDGFLGDSAYLLTPNSSVVPIPAAAWLFASGLITLVSFTRRNEFRGHNTEPGDAAV